MQPEYHKTTIQRERILGKFEEVSPNLNDKEKNDVIPEWNNSQINPSAEPHNGTVKQEFFKTARSGSTRETNLLAQTTIADAQRWEVKS